MSNAGPETGEAAGSYGGGALYLASLGPGEYVRLLDETAFEVAAHAVADSDAGGRTAWLAPFRS